MTKWRDRSSKKGWRIESNCTCCVKHLSEFVTGRQLQPFLPLVKKVRKIIAADILYFNECFIKYTLIGHFLPSFLKPFSDVLFRMLDHQLLTGNNH